MGGECLRNVAASVFALSVASPFASAQLTPPPLHAIAEPRNEPVDVDASIKELGSPDLRVREFAESRLRSAGLTIVALTWLLSSPDLSHEQRERLTRLGPEALRTSPRGALGFSYNRVMTGDGVVVQSTVRGFDAERVLRAGDVLRRVGGVEVSDAFDLRPAIIAHDPGDEVELEVVRGGQTLITSVRMGDFDRLDSADMITDEHLERAWQIRLSRLRKAASRASLEPATEPDEIARLASAVGADGSFEAQAWDGWSQSRSGRWARSAVAPAFRVTSLLDPQVVAGGIARGVPAWVNDLDAVLRTSVRVVPNDPVQARAAQDARRRVNEQLAANRRALIEQYQENDRRLRDPALAEQDRAMLKQSNAMILELLRDLDRAAVVP